MRLLRHVAVMLAVCSGSTALADPWQSEPAFPTPAGRSWAKLFQLSDGAMMAVGGTPFSGEGPGSAVHRRPLNAPAWTATIETDDPVIGGASGVDGLGRIVVYGGINPDNGDLGSDRIYDPIEGFIGSIASRGGSWPEVYFAAARDPQGRLYSMGGNRSQSGPNGGASPHASRYDAATDTWTVLAPMPTPVADAAGVYDGHGHILVIGGILSSRTTRTANVARYDIAANLWSDSAIADLPTATSGLCAVLGSDGRVYAIGGETGAVGAGGAGQVVADVWVLDPTGGTWVPSPNGSMLTPRKHFGAALDTVNTRIVVAGGETAGGVATNLCESLYTPICPQVTSDLSPQTTAWTGSTAAMTAAFSGGHPMTFEWTRNGVLLHDGDLDGRVQGASTPSLTIASVHAADSGVYRVTATNPCGSVESAPGQLSLNLPPSVDASGWNWHSLHPPGSPSYSAAYKVNDGRIVGYITTGPDPLYPRLSYFTHAAMWVQATPHSSFTLVDLNPPGTVQSGAHDLSPDGTLVVGFWYHPYYTPQGWGFYQRPYAWSFSQGGASGEWYCRGEYGSILSTDGIRSAGHSFGDWNDPSYNEYWGPGPGPSIGVAQGNYGGVGMDAVLGTAAGHATAWLGSSPVDMHPAGASSSSAASANDGQVVGSAVIGGIASAMVWGGIGSMSPTSLGEGAALDVHQGVQVGVSQNHAMLWTGNIQSRVDLHDVLPDHYSGSAAYGVWVDSVPGRIVVAGTAFNTLIGKTEAMAWVYEPSVPCDADFNHDGGIDGADIGGFFSAWEAGDLSADVNDDGGVDGGDIDVFFQQWEAGGC